MVELSELSYYRYCRITVIKTSGGAPVMCAEHASKCFGNENQGNQKASLNDLVRDLGLSKEAAEILGSRLTLNWTGWALKKDSDAVKYLMTKFPKISCSKLTEGIFIEPQILKLINGEEFIATLKEDVKNA
ncbi:CLCN7 [Cordylochernes scorpioides]|uniref:CLCN7 n=1 Tax=Cordylochernes scorpioides TaxID=51811 RepID=A0ABY6KKW2_9ARAC|nr:CLCN7 [Cordylochernes scorpioides]